MFLSTTEIVAVQPFADKHGDNRSVCSNIEISTIDETKSCESDFEFEGLKEIHASTGNKDDINLNLVDSGDDSDLTDDIYNICLVDTIGYGAYMDVS
jgi:hypothetical protein